MEMAEESKDDNDLRLRRVYQTPTLTLYMPCEREQTNRVIRAYHMYKEFFFRFIIVDENLKKTHFGNIKQIEMLEKLKLTLKKSIYIGDCQANVLNYSNSQLKNHSVWMICRANIAELEP